MYECFHCGEKSVIWDCDFGLDEWEYDSEQQRIVHTLHCTNYGAEITYILREENEQ